MQDVERFKSTFAISGLMFLAIDIDAGSKSGSKDVPAVIDRILDKAHPDTFEILVTSGKSYEFNGEGRFIRHTDNDVHDPADLRSRKFDFLSNNLVLSSCGTVRSLLSSECQMLDDQDLPKLVLSCSLWYPFKDMSKWHAITHQCHGMICNHIEMLVMDLNPKLEVQKSMIELSRKWLDSEAAFDHVRLSTLYEYREDVISMF